MEGHKLLQREGDEPDTLHVLTTRGELMESKCSRYDKLTGMVDLNSEADTYPLHRMEVKMTATAVNADEEAAMFDGELVTLICLRRALSSVVGLKKAVMLVTDSEVEEEPLLMYTQA